VKLSGLPTCASTGALSATRFQPVIDHLLNTFGPTRIVWGGDWPVCTLACSLGDWSRLSDELLAPLSSSEQTQIFSGNARRLYRL
jgi:L-fuconolactonase